MKKNLQIGFLGTLLFAFAAASFAQAPKIATVDMRRVFETDYKTIQANIAISNEVADVQKQHDSMVATMRKLNDEYKQALDKANDQAISSDERDKNKKTAQEKLESMQGMDTSIRSYDDQSQARLGETSRTRMDTIIRDIKSMVAVRAKAAGYSLVLDVSGETMRGVTLVLYSNGENDITDALIKDVNAIAPPASPPATNVPPANAAPK